MKSFLQVKQTLTVGLFCMGMTLGIAACNQENEKLADTEVLQEQDSVDTTQIEAAEDVEKSLQETVESMRPTAVQLNYEFEAGGYVAGSGFLMEITEENIYICTNRHVVDEYDDWSVCFFDGTKASGIKLGVSDAYDVAVVQVDREAVPKEVMDDLEVVSMDLEYWKSLGVAELEIGLIRVGREGDVVHILTGKMIRKETDFPWGNGAKHTEFIIDQEAGDSGSAVFDKDGRMLAMVMGNSTDVGGVRNWGIPLDAVIVCYEEITGRTLE